MICFVCTRQKGLVKYKLLLIFSDRDSSTSSDE